MKKQVSPPAMTSRRSNASEEDQTISLRRSQDNADELLLKFPMDLVVEIFSRMTLKSIATCRCVSKRWASILRCRDFTELFFTKSLARPQLLFARREENELIFLSSPQPQNCGENVSVKAADHRASFPVEEGNYISNIVNGFFCISHYRTLEGIKTNELVSVICNPSTKQSFTLPEMKTSNSTELISFLGFDPIEKQHKVLPMIVVDIRVVEHQVLTLGAGNNMTWRLTECDIPHYHLGESSICINGVLYYAARASGGDYMIVCFDVRSEKFSFVNFMEREARFATLINFQSKLASVRSRPEPYFINRNSTSVEMCILEDPEKHEWSKRIFKLPPMWKDVVASGDYLYFVGLTATNEFVFSPVFSSNPFHFYYYSFFKKTITRVEIQGRGAFERLSRVRIFLNHVEELL